jgi:hypothetical protein
MALLHFRTVDRLMMLSKIWMEKYGSTAKVLFFCLYYHVRGVFILLTVLSS